MLKQSGFSLIELMISMVISLFLISAILWFYASSSSFSIEYFRYAKLTESMQKVLTPIANDIRRAGFWNVALNDVNTGLNTNPYMADAVDLQTNAGNNCVLLSYDLTLSGGTALPTLNATGGDNRFGYRLNIDSSNGNTLQMRPLQSLTFSCTSGTWTNMTDPNNTLVTAFSVVFDNKTIPIDDGGNLILRYATISMTAQEADDTSISKTITQTVKVGNDKYIP